MSAKIEQQDKTLSIQRLLGQLRALLPVIAAMYVPVLFILALIKIQDKIPAGYLTRDPLALAKAPFYWGFLSNIGVLLWCATAAICLFSFMIIRGCYRAREFKQFFLFSGCISALLGLDDLFLLHEVFFPNYLKIPETIVFLGYGAMLGLYLFKSIKTILKTDFILIVLAFVFLGLSITVDLVGSSVLIEDGFKLLGIVSWFTYFTRVCATQLKAAIVLQPANAKREEDVSLTSVNTWRSP